MFQTDVSCVSCATTLQSEAAQEAKKLSVCIEAKVESILKTNNFDEMGYPLDTHPHTISPTKLVNEIEYQEVLNKFKNNIPVSIQERLNNKVVDNDDFKRVTERINFEDKNLSVNISVDDICCKQQKEHRKIKKVVTPAKKKRKRKCNTEGQNPKYRSRPHHNVTVSHIQTTEGQYVLATQGTPLAIRNATALILENKLIDHNFVFYTDGQRTLQDSILTRTSWHQSKIVLDWYHLNLKCEKQLYVGCKKGIQKDEFILKLVQLLWWGMTDTAIALLDQVPQDIIKEQLSINGLKTYIERNKAFIPFYALRKELGLRNSSAIGEKYNDLVVAQRQKRNGMSWSKDGTDNLAILKTLTINKELEIWLATQSIDFKIAA